ncbi:hypothetical protein [Actinokineospora bangkokensis]|uniref:Uncharacterized protein n=1 Tax=Actinokineospora bangkokensis TaxID=1193682 RepID=A0A1Q9LFR1_9PSEU|nr:hypothetical protein [Actinokineospora bangkokensis]OLR90868.1 hypothetical protein BJP25_30370 [Actinokineospora bangkokensis]
MTEPGSTAGPEAEVRAALRAAVVGEPPLALDRDAVFAAGRGRARRRALVQGVAAVAFVAALAGGIAVADRVAAPHRAPVAAGPSTAVDPPVLGLVRDRAVLDRMSDALAAAPVTWPADVTGKVGGFGPWYRFSDYATLYTTLRTPTGDRVLTVRVTGPDPAAADRPPCPVGTGDLGCRVEPLPGGALVRRQVGRDVGFAFVRADGSSTLVSESDPERGSTRGQVLPDATLRQLATLPGLAP